MPKRQFSDEVRISGLMKSLKTSEWGVDKTDEELREKAQEIIDTLEDLNNRG